MKTSVLAAVLLLAAAPAVVAQGKKAAEETILVNDVSASGAGLLNLSCLATLVAIGHADLTGIFSFIPEKDSAPALADFLVRNKSAMKKYIVKLDMDSMETSGITAWDHEVVMRTLELYASPLAQTLEKPARAVSKKLSTMSLAPTMTLEEMTLRRRR